MDTIGANARTAHALDILETWRDFTLERLRDAAYDNHLHAFATLLPGLAASFDALGGDDIRRDVLSAPIARLRAWDCRSAADSVATTLAVAWGDVMRGEVAADIRPGRLPAIERIGGAP